MKIDLTDKLIEVFERLEEIVEENENCPEIAELIRKHYDNDKLDDEVRYTLAYHEWASYQKLVSEEEYEMYLDGELDFTDAVWERVDSLNVDDKIEYLVTYRGLDFIIGHCTDALPEENFQAFIDEAEMLLVKLAA